MKIDNESNINYENNEPSEKLIVDFDDMYMNYRNKGLDCKNKFEKDHAPDDYNENDE